MGQQELAVWVGFWALFKHRGRRRKEGAPSCIGLMLCPPWQKDGRDEELRFLGSAQEPSGAAQIQWRDHLHFPLQKEELSVDGEWVGRGCHIAVACPTCPSCLSFQPLL